MKIFMLLVFLPCYAVFPLQEALELKSPLRDDLEELVPYEGVFGQNYLGNLYDQKLISRQLLGILFRRKGNISLDQTHLAFRVGGNLTPFEIGVIRGKMITGNWNTEIFITSPWTANITRNREFARAELNNPDTSRHNIFFHDLKLVPDSDEDRDALAEYQYVTKMNKELNYLLKQFKDHPRDKNYIAILDTYLWSIVTAPEDYQDYFRGLETQLGPEIYGTAHTPQVFKESSQFKRFAGSHVMLLPDYGVSGTPSYNDCTETAIRNFFLVTLEDNCEITRSRVHESFPNADARFLDYWDSYPLLSRQHTQQARNDWGTVISGRDGVNYQNSDRMVSMLQGSQNLLLGLNLLLGESWSWDELFKNMNIRLNKKIEKIRAPEEDTWDDTFTFLVDNHRYYWSINTSPGHTYIEGDTSSVTDEYREKFEEGLLSTHPLFPPLVLSFLPPSLSKSRGLVRYAKENGKPVETTLMTSLRYPIDRLNWILAHKEEGVTVEKKILREMFNSLDNAQDKIKFFANLPDGNIDEYFDTAVEFFKGTNDSDQGSFIYSVLKNPSWFKYEIFIPLILERKTNLSTFITSVLAKLDMVDVELLKELIGDPKLHREITRVILAKNPEYYPSEIYEIIIEAGKADQEMITYILKNSFHDRSDWLEILLKRENNVILFWDTILTQEFSSEHPEWVRVLLPKIKFEFSIKKVLEKPWWKDTTFRCD